MATHNSIIDHKNKHFVITDRPTEATVETYTKKLKECGTTALVRVCEPSYDTACLTAVGIRVFDFAFDDGDPPPDDVIDKWLALDEEMFAEKDGGSGRRIAVHCIAGLGRAPVMVAISLVEAGMSPEDAVLFIREKRRGAINKRQLLFLRGYQRRSKKKAAGCTIL
eukprot:UC1_evm1s321